MSRVTGGIFNFADRLGMAALDQRVQKANVISANVANAETPGYRALGYDFEEQLQSLSHLDQKLQLNVASPKHLRNAFTEADGKIKPDVFVRPTESVGEDGNTVDVDKEMVDMAQNQLLYRSSVELLNRKVGVLKYAINGGR
jgi:flagellar basal-body rod protein FlgB